MRFDRFTAEIAEFAEPGFLRPVFMLLRALRVLRGEFWSVLQDPRHSRVGLVKSV